MQNRNDQPTDGIRKVIEAEIINPDYHDDGTSQQASFRRTYHSQGPVYTGIFTTSSLAGGGCLAQAIPFGLFLACLGQYGVLAAIGFGLFYLVGSAIGTLREARALVEGRIFNPWVWRIGNWIVCYLLTVWLAGGFNE